MKNSLFENEHYLEILESIRLHAETTRKAQLDYFRNRTEANLHIAQYCEMYLDSLLTAAADIVKKSGQLEIF